MYKNPLWYKKICPHFCVQIWALNRRFRDFFTNKLFVGVYLNFILKKKKNSKNFVEVGLEDAKCKKIRVTLFVPHFSGEIKW